MLFWTILLGLSALAAFVYFTHYCGLIAKIERRKREQTENFERARKFVESVSAERRKAIWEVVQKSEHELLDKLRNGSFKCVEVLAAFTQAALKANESTNAVTLFIDEAREQAREMDEGSLVANEKDASQVPPLFGLPISVKECVMMKGYDQTRGYVQYVGCKAEHNALQMDHYMRAGAVPFVLTNVPLSLLSISCENAVYGTTTNPHNANRTSGGSSGGEAALIAAGGSVLGIGGDVGGSIRIPAHFSGIVGLKPSHLRFSSRHFVGSVPGRPFVDASQGPMAKSVDLCAMLCRAAWQPEISKDDPYVPPVPWREELYASPKRLRIGYYVDDGWFTPTTPMARAVRETVKLLEGQGHTLVPFEPPRLKEAFRLFVGGISLDGNSYLVRHMARDVWVRNFVPTFLMYALPLRLQSLIALLCQRRFPRIAYAVRSVTHDAKSLRATYEKIGNYRHEFVQAMAHQQLDLFLCPPQVSVAYEHAVACKLATSVSYTAVFNMLDFAGGVVPVTKVQAKDVEEHVKTYPSDDPWYKMVKNSLNQECIGLPVGVQVVGPPYSEEKVLAVMKEIESNVPEMRVKF